ncbi:MAG: hypothetical protein PHU23_00105 [Dehalococcoidales bacterium]|nr:hypothetical protein [Dehalococcoidales bacterium]
MSFEDIPESLIRIAGVLGGDRIAFGFLFKKLSDEGINTEIVRNHIRNKLNLFNSDDINWPKWRDLFEKARLAKYLTKERFEQEFQKHMPDICQCVREEPDGINWFNSQLSDLRIKLGVEIVPSRFVKINHSIDNP